MPRPHAYDIPVLVSSISRPQIRPVLGNSSYLCNNSSRHKLILAARQIVSRETSQK